MSKVVIQGKTDVGVVRKNNEDNLLVTDNILSEEWSFSDKVVDLDEHGAVLIVADGMGGEVAGELASKLAVDSIRDYFKNNYDDLNDDARIVEHMNIALIEAHKSITSYVKGHAEYYGMGTTATINFIKNDKLYISWVGDSRTYRYSTRGRVTAHDYFVRDLEILTNDHSQVWMSVLSGKMTPEEARVAPNSNVITQSLGDIYRLPSPEHRVFDLYEGDLILSCSDGLNGMFSDDKLESILREKYDSLDLKEELIHNAKIHGGEDNITVAICRVVSGNPYAIAVDITEDITEHKSEGESKQNIIATAQSEDTKSGLYMSLFLGLSALIGAFIAFNIFSNNQANVRNESSQLTDSFSQSPDNSFASEATFDGVISIPDTVKSKTIIEKRTKKKTSKKKNSRTSSKKLIDEKQKQQDEFRKRKDQELREKELRLKAAAEEQKTIAEENRKKAEELQKIEEEQEKRKFVEEQKKRKIEEESKVDPVPSDALAVFAKSSYNDGQVGFRDDVQTQIETLNLIFKRLTDEERFVVLSKVNELHNTHMVNPESDLLTEEVISALNALVNQNSK